MGLQAVKVFCIFLNPLFFDYSCFISVMLVERNPEPNGVPLVNSKRVATRNFDEMMELEENHILVSNLTSFYPQTVISTFSG